jgi:cobalt-zinc-cadmium efflux system outer membrane protein
MSKTDRSARNRGAAIVLGVLAFALAQRPVLVHADATKVRLADLLAEAHERNPEIQAARQRAVAAAAVPRRVTALDDPVFAYEAWNAPNSLRVDRADNNILRLSQKVPFPGKRALAGEVAKHDADMTGAEVATVELEVEAAVKRAYYELWSAHELLAVYNRDRGIVERFTHVAEQKYGVGEASQSDVLRAQVELTRAINRASTETLAIDGMEAELNALLSRPPDGPVGVPEPPPPPRLERTVDSLFDVALHSRPELQAQQAAVAREDAAVRLAERNYLPDFEFSVARFINPGTRDGFGGMAAVSIPLANKSKYDAALEEARARLGAAKSELRRVQDRIQREVKQAYVRANTALVQRKLFVSTHIPQAEQSLRVAESAYQTGTVDWLSLTDTSRSLEAVHVDHIEAEAEFEKAYADLERAVGTELPRDGNTSVPATDAQEHSR